MPPPLPTYLQAQNDETCYVGTFEDLKSAIEVNTETIHTYLHTISYQHAHTNIHTYIHTYKQTKTCPRVVLTALNYDMDGEILVTRWVSVVVSLTYIHTYMHACMPPTYIHTVYQLPAYERNCPSTYLPTYL